MGYAEEADRSIAPRSGAWIETFYSVAVTIKVKIAPRSGAWIETLVNDLMWTGHHIAPRSGAWIETPLGRFESKCQRNRPSLGGVD